MPVSTRNRVTLTTSCPSSHRPMNSASSSPNSLMLPSSNTISLSSQVLSLCHAIFSLIHSPLLPNTLARFLLHIALLMGKKCLVVQKSDVPLDIIAALGCKSQEGGEGPGFIDFELAACLHFLLLWQKWTCECDYGNQGEGLAAGPPTPHPAPQSALWPLSHQRVSISSA